MVRSAGSNHQCSKNESVVFRTVYQFSYLSQSSRLPADIWEKSGVKLSIPDHNAASPCDIVEVVSESTKISTEQLLFRRSPSKGARQDVQIYVIER